MNDRTAAAALGRCGVGGWCAEQLTDAWNHLAPIELDRREPLLVGHSAQRISQIEAL
jgi:hypothetical protein